VAAARLAWLVSWPAYREHGAAWAIRADAACRRNGYLRPLAILGAALLMPSNLLFVQHSLAQVTSDSQTKVLAALMPPFYLPEAEWKAFDWMRQKLPREAVVGCLPLAGSYLPGRIGRTVYCGHWAETIDFPKKVSALTWFYRDPASAKEKVGFLREAGITHVYFGAYELQLARGQLPRMPALKLVYPARLPAPPELPPVAIYQVLPAEGE
ncbi:MAG: hypothetical protein HUU35_18705, partial [Armatimonadetes bacterium]|nr:hypothetical protein [Armatimonadota bacterium]